MITRTHLLSAALIVTLTSGCLGPDPVVTEKLGSNDRAIQQIQRTFEESTQRSRAQLDAMERDQAQLNQRLATLEAGNAQLAREVASINDDLKTLNGLVQQLQAARATDRKEVVEEISKRMTALLQKQAQSNRGSSGGPVTGMVHKVRPGETPSQIAAAYNVTTAVLIRVNNLDRPDRLKIDQEIIIPD